MTFCPSRTPTRLIRSPPPGALSCRTSFAPWRKATSSSSVAGVDAVSPKTADHIRRYLQSYGATLVELPEAAWETSVAQWMETHWDVLVDLWTAEEGPSDLVLAGEMRDTDDGPRFSIHLVYVP
jgi:hypothetical protein